MYDPETTNEYFVEDPLDIAFNNDENLTVAIESISTIYHGLILTPHRSYADKRVQQALRSRIDELSAVSNFSSESIHLAIDGLANKTYSTENAFFDAVKSVVEKIIEWLSMIRDFIVKVIRKIINVRTQNKATNSKTASDFKESRKSYEKNMRDFPSTISLQVPGQCYLAFHTTKHKPQAGFVYNTNGLLKALENVDREMNVFVDNLTKEVDNTLDAISILLDQMDTSKVYRADDVVRKLNSTKVLAGLYHNNFEMLGFGIIAKPVRNSTKYIETKYGLTNVVNEHGWNKVESFDIVIETGEFEKLHKLFGEKSDEMIGKIVALNTRLADSRAIKRLATSRKDLRTVIEILANDSDPSQTALIAKKNLMGKLDLIHELTSQLTDTCLLTARFYTRYTLMQGKIFELAAKSLNAEA